MNTANNPAANITAFLTAAGVDLVLRKDGTQLRARAPYESMSCELAGSPVLVDFTETDDELVVTLGKLELTLTLQPKGHYFGWLQQIAKAEPIDIVAARKLHRDAMRAKAGKTKAA